MTTADIIRMAKEAGMVPVHFNRTSMATELSAYPVELERFATLVAAAEREACAKVCDDLHHAWRFGDGEDSESGPKDCAAAIRARSQQTGAAS